MAVLRVRGASEHNLRGVDLDLPRERLVVFTGVSGSGKSSLAFDTLYAEARRRFVEALAPQARARFGSLTRPAFDWIDGLTPAIGLAQAGAATPSPRATVGTLTEVWDLLRVLWSRVGVQHCPRCDRVMERTTLDGVVRELLALPADTAVTLAAPLARARRGPLGPLLEEVRRQGFGRVRLDGALARVEELGPVDARLPHDLDVVVDRLRVDPSRRDRLQDSVATAARAGQGAVLALVGEAEHLWTTGDRCAACSTPLPEKSPRLFSFFTPAGACPTCEGLGRVGTLDAERLVVDPEATLTEGALEGGRMAVEVAERLGVSVHTPWRALPWEARSAVLDGRDEVPGLARQLARKAAAPDAPERLRRLWREEDCPACGGSRLREAARAVRLRGRSLPEVAALPLAEAEGFFAGLERGPVAAPLVEEIGRRLRFLVRSGLGHLSLDRPAASLSAGEHQRARLSATAGNQLSGVLYVLDEPTAGLHPEDTRALVELLLELRDAGNTVLVVEHDPAVIAAADRVVDFGPGAGAEGGRVVFEGSPDALRAADTPTGRWLRGDPEPPPPPRRGAGALRVRGARGHNLRGVDVDLPRGVVTGVTGVSGAGKSSLVFDTLGRAVARHLDRGGPAPLPHAGIDGLETVRRLVRDDGGGLGRSPRSTPATLLKVWDEIRELYAKTPEARLRGFTAAHFRFNQPGGRCEACQGEGVRHVDLQYLPEVVVTCEVCDGKRYDEATLSVTWRGRSIADVLATSVREARTLFSALPAIAGPLGVLDELGLGYLPLGQRGDTLSGGEARRLALARELARPSDLPGTLYLLDEPSVGLHPQDVATLAAALRRLGEGGATVVVVDHDPVLLSRCDHLVELGPGAGAEGGRVIAEGTPAAVAATPQSRTGPWLGVRAP